MKVFLFGGSKGGCGRTTTSVLCALGLALMGIRVSHLQVLGHGREGIRISPLAPFSSLRVPETNVLKAVAANIVDGQATPDGVLVVDCPVNACYELDLFCSDATLFLPVRPGVSDSAALHSDLVQLFDRAAQKTDFLRGVNGFHVVPIGFSQRQYSRLQEGLATFEARRTLVAFSVINPGVPHLDPLDLHLWVGGGEFEPNNLECFYSSELARAAWRCSEMRI